MTMAKRLSRPSLRVVLAVAVVLATATAEARGQRATTSTLHGQVVDSIGGDPIAGVLIRTADGSEARSDALGRFSVAGLEPGPTLLALLTADCRVTWAQLDLPPGVGSEVELRLPPAFGAAARERESEEARRRRSKGRIIVASEIAETTARSGTDLVRLLAPSMVGGWSGVAGDATTITGRAPSSIENERAPVLLVDGARVHDVALTLDQILPSEIDTLEVLPGAAGGWQYGSGGSAGVIRVVRRRGVATGTPEDMAARECVVPGMRRELDTPSSEIVDTSVIKS